MRRTQIYLSEVQTQKIKKLSEQLGLPMSEYIRRIIDTFLEAKWTANDFSSLNERSRWKE